MEDLCIQLLSGNVAGWSLVTTGMPLDLLKTKLQLNRHLTVNYFKQQLKHHGGFFKTFYRGASSMYLFIGFATALQFTVFQTCFQIAQGLDIKKQYQLMMSGFMAGLGSSLVYTPIQFAKIKTQLDPSPKKLGSAKRILIILKQQKLKGFKTIYTGLPYTMMKEGPGIAIYFGGFHVCMMDVFGQKDRQNAKLSSQIGSSFITSLMYNYWGYPFDTFKTNVQSGASTVKNLIKNKFWKQKSYKQGMIICLLRGLIVDSTNLTVYQRSRNFLNKLIKNQRH